jgi:hypothetical protein
VMGLKVVDRSMRRMRWMGRSCVVRLSIGVVRLPDLGWVRVVRQSAYHDGL